MSKLGAFIVLTFLCWGGFIQAQTNDEQLQEKAKQYQQLAISNLLNHELTAAAMYTEYRAALDTTNVEWQYDAGVFFQKKLKDHPSAMNYYYRAIKQAKQQYGDTSQWVAKIYEGYGDNYFGWDNHVWGDLRYADALRYYIYACATWELVEGENSIHVAECYNKMGKACSHLDNENAMPYYQKAKRIADALPEPNLLLSSQILDNIGLEYMKNEDWEMALDYFNQEHDIVFDKKSGAFIDIQQAVTCLLDLANVQEKLGNDASYYLFNALSIQKEVLGNNDVSIADTYLLLGQYYKRHSDLDKALIQYQQAVGIFTDNLGEYCIESQPCYTGMASIYYSKKQYEEALRLLERSLLLEERFYGKDRLYGQIEGLIEQLKTEMKTN